MDHVVTSLHFTYTGFLFGQEDPVQAGKIFAHHPDHGFKVVATSGELVAAIEDPKRRLYGVQFHPEVDLSVDGTAMLKNFLFGVCKLSGSYSAACRQDIAIDYIRKTVGPTKKVLCLVSGGVDSSVCAALLHRALGPERLICLHIDHGFMRHEESSGVVKALRALGVPLEALDASKDFANSTTDIKGEKTKVLCETVAPEEKRKIIGDTFMRVTEAMCAERGLTAEIAGGSLVVNKAVVVRKVAGESRLVVEGAYGDDYLRVRDLLYAQYTVV